MDPCQVPVRAILGKGDLETSVASVIHLPELKDLSSCDNRMKRVIIAAAPPA